MEDSCREQQQHLRSVDVEECVVCGPGGLPGVAKCSVCGEATCSTHLVMSAQVETYPREEVYYWAVDGVRRLLRIHGGAAKEWVSGERICLTCRNRAYQAYIAPLRAESDRAAEVQRKLISEALPLLDAAGVRIPLCTSGHWVKERENPHLWRSIDKIGGYCWDIGAVTLGDTHYGSNEAHTLLCENGEIFVKDWVRPEYLVDEETDCLLQVIQVIPDESAPTGVSMPRMAPLGRLFDHDDSYGNYGLRLALDALEANLRAVIANGGETSTEPPRWIERPDPPKEKRKAWWR